jgi:hypothetical protein
MLAIRKNSNNKIVVTLREKQTLANPYFLFEFKSEVSMKVVTTIMDDLSSFPERFNEFLLTETNGTQIATSGTIELTPEGMWTYRVFEQESDTNLDVELVDNKEPLEVGVVRVIGNQVQVTRNDNNDTEYTVYEP